MLAKCQKPHEVQSIENRVKEGQKEDCSTTKKLHCLPKRQKQCNFDCSSKVWERHQKLYLERNGYDVQKTSWSREKKGLSK